MTKSAFHKYLKEIGKKGGDSTLAKRGKEYYAEIGRKGGKTPRKTKKQPA